MLPLILCALYATASALNSQHVQQTYDIRCPKHARELRFGLKELESALARAGLCGVFGTKTIFEFAI